MATSFYGYQLNFWPVLRLMVNPNATLSRLKVFHRDRKKHTNMCIQVFSFLDAETQ